MKLELGAFMLRLVPHIVASAPAIARALFQRTGGDLARAKAELRFVRDHRGAWESAQAGFEERLRALDKDPED